MLVKFLLISTLLFVCCNGKSLEFSSETKESLIPETEAKYKVLAKLSGEEILELGLFGLKHMKEMALSTEEDQEKLTEEFKRLSPEINAKFNSAIEELKQEVSKMSEKSQEFFEFYNEQRNGLTAEWSNDEQFSKFVCEVLPKWRELDVDTVNEIKEKFSKLYETLNDKQIQQMACNFSTDSTVEKETSIEFV